MKDKMHTISIYKTAFIAQQFHSDYARSRGSKEYLLVDGI